ncbi:MAG: thiol-activated cytolysin family protein [Clostridiales bacterium]|nr:thiol-activated cytolysin family protein [Candidatus Crickella equi]
MGNYSLDEYLNRLSKLYDKKTILAKCEPGKLQYGRTAQLKDNGDAGLIIIEKIEERAEDVTGDISTINANLNGVYPGALLHVDSNLAEGKPTAIYSKDLPRNKLEVGLEIAGNTQPPVMVDEPSEHNVMATINTMVDKWLSTGKTASAEMSYKSAFAYNEKQLDTKIGIEGASKIFGVDIKACETGTKKEMLVSFKQVYYSASVNPEMASSLFRDDVNDTDLARYGINENNPAVGEVTKMDFGRQIVVKLSSDNCTDKIEAAWNASICGTGFTNRNEYKNVMENTTFNVFVYGGKTDTAAKLITTTNDIGKVNEIIASDMNFNKDSAARPLSYLVKFVDDGTQACVQHSTDYIRTVVTKRDKIHFSTDAGGAYVTKHQKLFARAITGVNDDGSYILGSWECLMNEKGGDKCFDINGKYAEFGFSFDIVWGTDWPYSGVFWTLDKGPVKDISIKWGGAVRNAWVEIRVNNDLIFSDSDCYSHEEHIFI